MPRPGCAGTLTRTRSSLRLTGRRPPPAQAATVIPGQRPGTGMVSGHTVRRSCEMPAAWLQCGMLQVPGSRGKGCSPCSCCLLQQTSLSWPCSSAAHTWCHDAAGPEQSTGQAPRALLLRRQSRVSGICDGALPFTPPFVLPDFALALTSACSLDPTLALGAPVAVVPGGAGRDVAVAAAAGRPGGKRSPSAHMAAWPWFLNIVSPRVL